MSEQYSALASSAHFGVGVLWSGIVKHDTSCAVYQARGQWGPSFRTGGCGGL